MKLAFEIVQIYHSKKDAQSANDYFIKTFSKKEIPETMPKFKPSKYDMTSVLVESKLASSKSEARRIIEQGGVKIDGKVIKDIRCVLLPGSVLQKGKIKFIKIS
jgi:tyrosyl-tRNA synthetase